MVIMKQNPRHENMRKIDANINDFAELHELFLLCYSCCVSDDHHPYVTEEVNGDYL